MFSTVQIFFTLVLVLVAFGEHFKTKRLHFFPIQKFKQVPYISLQEIQTDKRNVQRKIVSYHNFLRTKVIPSASNMLEMKWHPESSVAAQKWSEKCTFLTHDSKKGRFVPKYGACGQNIFISSRIVPWIYAITQWYLEKHDFKYGSPNNTLMFVGHYTQMVWASTHEVGCGVTQCFTKINGTKINFYNYVCNYCPIGNIPSKIGQPYKKGTPCSNCSKNCNQSKLCTNSCQEVNILRNCDKMYKVWPKWLCHSAKMSEKCRATCLCQNKIYGH